MSMMLIFEISIACAQKDINSAVRWFSASGEARKALSIPGSPPSVRKVSYKLIICNLTLRRGGG